MSAVEKLNLSACMGQEDVDKPMSQAEFLAQTPARWALMFYCVEGSDHFGF